MATPLQPRYATVGDLLFGGLDDFGNRVDLVDLVGWDGSTATTLTSEPRVADHGAWISDGWHPGRPLEAQLAVYSPSWAACSEALSRLVGGIPLAAPEPMVVNDSGLELVADVVQNGEVLSTRKANTARVSVPLLAPDPRRYGVDEVSVSTALPVTTGGLRLSTRVPFRVQAVVVAGVLQVINDGTIATSPRFTIDGPCSPFTLTQLGTGRTLRHHEDVPAGRTLVIDVASRTALLDGTAPRYVSGSWFDYPPGLTEVAFTADVYNAASLLTSVHRSAWK